MTGAERQRRYRARLKQQRELEQKVAEEKRRQEIESLKEIDFNTCVITPESTQKLYEYLDHTYKENMRECTYFCGYCGCGNFLINYYCRKCMNPHDCNSVRARRDTFLDSKPFLRRFFEHWKKENTEYLKQLSEGNNKIK